jgi:hypothetical protein
MTGVDSRGLTWTRGDATEARKRSGIELLSRKDERHRLVGNCRTLEFDSRQLHRIHKLFYVDALAAPPCAAIVP